MDDYFLLLKINSSLYETKSKKIVKCDNKLFQLIDYKNQSIDNDKIIGFIQIGPLPNKSYKEYITGKKDIKLCTIIDKTFAMVLRPDSYFIGFKRVFERCGLLYKLIEHTRKNNIEFTLDLEKLMCFGLRYDFNWKHIFKRDCTSSGKRIAQSLIKNAITRIFADPYQSIMELPVNSFDAYEEGRSYIGKFGMGFFSFLYWLYEDPNKQLEIITTYKINNVLCTYRIILKKVDENIKVWITKTDKSKKKTGTIIKLYCQRTKGKYAKKKKCGKIGYPDCPETCNDSYFTGEELSKFYDHLNRLRYYDRSELIVYDLYSSPGTQRENKITNNNSNKKVKVILDKNLIAIRDYGSGIPLEVAFKSLLIPSISTKTIALSMERKEHTINANIILGENGTRFSMVVGNIAVVDMKIENRFDNDYDIVIKFPLSTKLPVGRDDVIMNTDDSTYKIMLKSIDALVNKSIQYGNFVVLHDALKAYENYTPQSHLENRFTRYAEEKLYENTNIIPIPAKNIENAELIKDVCYRLNMDENFVYVKSYAYTKINEILKEKGNNNYYHNKWVIFVDPQKLKINENIFSLGLPNILFIDEYYKNNILESLSELQNEYNNEYLEIIHSDNSKQIEEKKDKKSNDVLEFFETSNEPQLLNFLSTIYNHNTPFKLIDQIKGYYRNMARLFYSLKKKANISQKAKINDMENEFIIWYKKLGKEILEKYPPQYGVLYGYIYLVFNNYIINLSGNINYEEIEVNDKMLNFFEEWMKRYINNIYKQTFKYIHNVYDSNPIHMLYIKTTEMHSDNLLIMYHNIFKLSNNVYEFMFITSLFNLIINLNEHKKKINPERSGIPFDNYQNVINDIEYHNLLVIFIREKIGKNNIISFFNMYFGEANGYDDILGKIIYLSDYSFLHNPYIKQFFDIIQFHEKYQQMQYIEQKIFNIPSKSYEVYTSELIDYVFKHDIDFTNKDLTIKEFFNGYDMVKNRKKTQLQVIEIAANVGSSKNVMESVVTELVQNSIDAIRENNPVNKRVDINVNTENNQIILEVVDYVGMTFNILFYLLIPYLSSKMPSINVTGEMGNGFFNVYKNSEYVEIYTAKGGKGYKLTTIPIKDEISGNVIDIKNKISYSETKENFTSIYVKFMKTDKNTTIMNLISLSNFVEHTFSLINVNINNEKISIYLNNKLLEIKMEILNEIKDKITVYEVKDELMKSMVLTNGIPFQTLEQFIEQNEIFNIKVEYISSNLLVNLHHGTYSPVQSRSKLSLVKSDQTYDGIIWEVALYYDKLVYLKYKDADSKINEYNQKSIYKIDSQSLYSLFQEVFPRFHHRDIVNIDKKQYLDTLEEKRKKLPIKYKIRKVIMDGVYMKYLNEIRKLIDKNKYTEVDQYIFNFSNSITFDMLIQIRPEPYDYDYFTDTVGTENNVLITGVMYNENFNFSTYASEFPSIAQLIDLCINNIFQNETEIFKDMRNDLETTRGKIILFIEEIIKLMIDDNKYRILIIPIIQQWFINKMSKPPKDEEKLLREKEEAEQQEKELKIQRLIKEKQIKESEAKREITEDEKEEQQLYIKIISSYVTAFWEYNKDHYENKNPPSVKVNKKVESNIGAFYSASDHSITVNQDILNKDDMIQIVNYIGEPSKFKDTINSIRLYENLFYTPYNIGDAPTIIHELEHARVADDHDTGTHTPRKKDKLPKELLSKYNDAYEDTSTELSFDDTAILFYRNAVKNKLIEKWKENIRKRM